MNLHTVVCIVQNTCVHIYIYIYREREIEIEREGDRIETSYNNTAHARASAGRAVHGCEGGQEPRRWRSGADLSSKQRDPKPNKQLPKKQAMPQT